jgi:hypothetical protein
LWQNRLDRGELRPELGVERPAQRAEIQIGDRALAFAAAEGENQPVDPADRAGDGADLVPVAAISLVPDQIWVASGEPGQAFLAAPGDVDLCVQAVQ